MEISNFRIMQNQEAGPLAHLVTLLKLKKASDSVKILMNIGVAALHLGYLLETPFHGGLPDLPDHADDYLAALQRYVHFSWSVISFDANFRLSADSQTLEFQKYPEEIAFLKEIYKETGKEKDKINLRSPLQLGLMISTIFLLVPMELHVKKWNRRDMIQVGMTALLCQSCPDYSSPRSLNYWETHGLQSSSG